MNVCMWLHGWKRVQLQHVDPITTLPPRILSSINSACIPATCSINYFNLSFKMGNMGRRFSKLRRMYRGESIQHKLKFRQKCGQSLSMRIPKSRLMQRCSRHFREQKTRFYIIWRCTVFLMRVAARLQYVVSATRFAPSSAYGVLLCLQRPSVSLINCGE
ncbi:hypothetical protein CR513_36060, partial [Mucuna pruriens]